MRFPYWQVLAVPALLFFLGAASNQAVLIANWGKFPVMLNSREVAKLQAISDSASDFNFPEFSVLDTSVRSDDPQLDEQGQFIDDVHSIMGKNSRLKGLADIFNLRDAIYSVGDFLIMLGSFLWFFAPAAWFVLILRKVNEDVCTTPTQE